MLLISSAWECGWILIRNLLSILPFLFYGYACVTYAVWVSLHSVLTYFPYLTPHSFWTIWRIFVKLGVNTVPLEVMQRLHFEYVSISNTIMAALRSCEVRVTPNLMSRNRFWKTESFC
jgi:hypothetical protein